MTAQSNPLHSTGDVMPFDEYLQVAAQPPQSGVHWPWSRLREHACSAPGERGTVALVSRPESGEAAPGVSVALQVVAPGSATTPHRHSFWHLYMVRSGRGLCCMDDAQHYPLAPGDVLYVPAWQAHSFRCDGRDPLVLLATQNLPQVAAQGTLVRQACDGDTQYVYRPSAIAADGLAGCHAIPAAWQEPERGYANRSAT